MDVTAYDSQTTIGLAALSRLAFQGADLNPVWNGLMARVSADPADAAAVMDLSTILQLTGQREQGLAIQAQALGLSRRYKRPHGRADALKLLALVVPGDMMANTPVDFLLEGSDVALEFAFVDANALDGPFPEHDLLLLAVGESPENQAVLHAIAERVAQWPRPAVNGDARKIAALTRDGVSALFAGSGQVLCPPNIRLSREALTRVAQGRQPLAQLISGAAFPIIVRPVGSHAGQGLEKIDGPEALAAYLDVSAVAEFYASPFIDYRSPDGLFRKQRIALIDGNPYISHLAISSHWMVHYLNAGMGEDRAKRDEEAVFMAGFRTGFAQKHAAAFRELYEKIGLDYFAIDCAEAPDGRLLLFEADVAMIVHALDSEETFPYKQPAMQELFAAFTRMLEAKAADRPRVAAA